MYNNNQSVWGISADCAAKPMYGHFANTAKLLKTHIICILLNWSDKVVIVISVHSICVIHMSQSCQIEH